MYVRMKRSGTYVCIMVHCAMDVPYSTETNQVGEKFSKTGLHRK